jgi:hypothetical protein
MTLKNLEVSLQQARKFEEFLKARKQLVLRLVEINEQRKP